MNTNINWVSGTKSTKNIILDKLGTVWLFLTALFSPYCFSIFAFAASALVGLKSIFGITGGKN